MKNNLFWNRAGFIFVACGLVLILLNLTNLSQAAMSEDQYLASLKLAQKKVERVKAAKQTAAAGALSSTLLRTLFGRYYAVGDNWDVAAWTVINPMARMTADPEHLKLRMGKGGVFHYEVVSVENGPSPSVILKVTQKDGYGLKTVDAETDYLQLTMNDQMMQSRKAYSRAGKLVDVSPEGIHSRLSPLELYPLDVPEISTAERIEPTALPELPEAVQKVASQVDYKPNLAQSLWFNQDDFFGRPVQILWQHGDPWPAYFKTDNGVAILLHKEVQ
ncbi:MAG: hypothetical protein ACXVBW_04055 [Bdellovibrionota bacterium]